VSHTLIIGIEFYASDRRLMKGQASKWFTRIDGFCNIDRVITSSKNLIIMIMAEKAKREK